MTSSGVTRTESAMISSRRVPLPEIRQAQRRYGLLPQSGCRLELDRGWKQHVVFKMHMAMKVALEPRELRQAHLIGGAAIDRRHIAAGQLSDRAQIVGGCAMLALHHQNRIANRAE